MSLEENKQFISRFVEKAINQKDLDAVDELVAVNFIEHAPFPGQGRGQEGLKAALHTLHTGFPDIHWTLDEQVAEGETVVSRFTFTGTHRGEFFGVPATGKSVKVWGVMIDVVRDGKLSESRILMDTISLLQQLDAIPGTGREE